MKLFRLVLMFAAVAMAAALSLHVADTAEAASYCPADIKRTQPNGCCPWQYASGGQCIDRPDMSEHADGYRMQAAQRCWRLTTCSCRGRQTPIGGGQCAPCTFTGVRVYCIRR